MKRTVSELRQAVLDAGWEGDPLASEILAALADAAAAPSAAPIPLPYGRGKVWLTVASAIGSAAIVGLVAVYLWSSTTIKARDEEIARIRTEAAAQQAHSEKELTRLEEANALQLSNAASQVQTLLKAAEVVSKNSADAAGSNHAAVNLYMTEFQKLLDEAKRLRDAPVTPATNK